MAALLAVSSAAWRAGAQTPPVKPYFPVAIVQPAASDDASFVAFRAALAAAAKSRIYADLAALVLTQGFFWDRDFGQRFDRRRPAVDNLALAIGLERDSGSGWNVLAEIAAEPAAEPLPSRPGAVCAPARPDYDGVAYARLLDASYTSAIDWAYPRSDRIAVRAAPQPDAAILDTLGLHFVRLLGFEGPDNVPHPGRSQWARVALPDARRGFVAPGELMSLTAERLCYIKDLVAGWRIAGYIAGGN